MRSAAFHALGMKKRVEDSERCLELFKRIKKDFLRRYVTMDETWIHHYTPEIKRSSAEWTAADESRPKRPKNQQWAGKVMSSVFWDVHGILCASGAETRFSVTAEQNLLILLLLRTAIAPYWQSLVHLNCACSITTSYYYTRSIKSKWPGLVAKYQV